MLEELGIEGVEIFEDGVVPFRKGLNVISGETGSGKSVLLACLLATLGEDPPRGLLRDGFLQSTWSFPPPPALGHLLEEEVWTLARQVRDGRASALCGGRGVSASLLREAAREIVLRSGQHASQELRQTAYHGEVLDSFAGVRLAELESAWRKWQEAESRLQKSRQQLGELQEREDFLRHEVEILREGAPRPGEAEELEGERQALLHSEERSDSLRQAFEALRGPAEESLALSENSLEKIAGYDARAGQIAETLSRLLLETQDASAEVQALLDGVGAEPGRLEDIERRLSEIQALRRRFRGASEEELQEMLGAKEEELLLLEGGESGLDEEEARVRDLEKQFRKIAKDAHSLRKKSAQKLAKLVAEELGELAVESSFVVDVAEGEPGPRGITQTEFLLSRSGKETPLREAASGGEISRISLALLLASSPGKRFFIFDEIDTGIGGETAHLLGEKLHQLAQNSQVLVVSHLPQIALRADHLIALSRKDGKTIIREANKESLRLAELARLAGARGEKSGASLEEMLREGINSAK